MSDGQHVRVNVCNQERGQMLTLIASPDSVAMLAKPIMDSVAMIERAAKVYCYAAWDADADELRAAMVALGALFAPGYCADVPVIVRRIPNE